MMTVHQSNSLYVLFRVGECFSKVSVTSNPYHATSLDYGFDFNEDELASELSAPLPASQADQPVQHVGADEFEKLFRWFNA
jgi:hypothetical protein